MPNVKQEYAASSGLVVTNLNSLPASQGLLGGWMSNTISNSVNKYLDYTASAKFTKAGANLQAGQIQVFVIPQLSDGNWPDILSSGTVGAEGRVTIPDDEQKNEYLQHLWSTATDTGANEVHNMRPVSIFNNLGYVPENFCFFVTSNATTTTTDTLASSGNEFHIKGYYESI